MKKRQLRFETKYDSILDHMSELACSFEIDQCELGDFRQVRFVLTLKEYALFKRSVFGKPRVKKYRRTPNGMFFEGLTWKKIPILFDAKASSSRIERTQHRVSIPIIQNIGILLSDGKSPMYRKSYALKIK